MLIGNKNTGHEDRKSILIKITILITIIVILVHSYDSYINTIKKIEDESLLYTLQYQKQERILKSKNDYEDKNKKLKLEYKNIIDNKFINANSLTLAEAKFQNIIRNICSKNKISLRTIRILQKYKYNGFDYLQVDISCKAEIGDIKNFLIDLNNSENFIFIKEIEIKNISKREKRFFYMNAKLIALTSS